MKYIKSLSLLAATTLVMSSCNHRGYGCDYTQVKAPSEKISNYSFTNMPNAECKEAE